MEQVWADMWYCKSLSCIEDEELGNVKIYNLLYGFEFQLIYRNGFVINEEYLHPNLFVYCLLKDIIFQIILYRNDEKIILPIIVIFL